MGWIARAGALGAGSILGTAAGVALWNIALSYMTRRRLCKGVRMVKATTCSGEEVTMAVYEAGKSRDGDHVIVLDAGLGMSALSWAWVMEEVSKTCRVVAIDRPGLGASPELKGKGWLRRVDQIVEMNKAVLKEMGIKGKMILVGHSTSGMHVRLHAHLYPGEVAGAVLVDAAHERQLNGAQGSSVYNSYPVASVTEAKLKRVKLLWNTGMLRVMYMTSGPTFWRLCTLFPPLFMALRLLDWLGRAAAQGVIQNEKILGPHFPARERRRFADEQFSLGSMLGMIAEHGSQRASMEYMQGLDLMQPGAMASLPLLVISRDPQKGAGGGLYPNARGDPTRESQHESFQVEQQMLSSAGRRMVVEGAGHGSLLFVKSHAMQTAKGILEVVQEVRWKS